MSKISVEKLNKGNVRDFISKIVHLEYNLNKILDELTGEATIHENKIILRRGEFYNVCVIDHKENKMSSITFYYSFNLSLKDLKELYGKYEKIYVPHDENFDFIFSLIIDSKEIKIRVFFSKENAVKSSEIELEKLENFQILFFN